MKLKIQFDSETRATHVVVDDTIVGLVRSLFFQQDAASIHPKVLVEFFDPPISDLKQKVEVSCALLRTIPGVEAYIHKDTIREMPVFDGDED